jgi:vacuolar protein sorting-associated protein 26
MSYAELFYDRGHHHEFLSLSQELAAPGELRQAQTFDFLFKNVEKQYESYLGINVKLRCVTPYCDIAVRSHRDCDA